jgi:hypothetical protein
MGLLLNYNLSAMTIAVRPYLERDNQTGEYHIVRYPRAEKEIFIQDLPSREYSTFVKPGDFCVYGEFEEEVGIIACKSGLLFENVSKLIGGSSTPWLNYPNYIGRSTYSSSSRAMGRIPIFNLNNIVYLKSKSPRIPSYKYED